MKQSRFVRWAKGTAGFIASITLICGIFIQITYCWWPQVIFCGFLLVGTIVSTMEAITGKLYTKEID